MKALFEEHTEHATLLSDLDEQCLGSLETIADVAKLLESYEQRIVAQSERLSEFSVTIGSYTAASSECTSILEAKLEARNLEYAELLGLLEKKWLECALIKIELDRLESENAKATQQIRQATRYIFEIKERFGL